MLSTTNFKKLSFLVYGLGLTGQSVVKFFKKNNFKNFQVWDDKIKNLYKSKRANDLTNTLKTANFIVLSPGVSLNKNIKRLEKYKRKIITDIDLIFLLYKFKKSIVVTGTNGKSTTCKIIAHVLKNNKFKVLLGGNIGTPILDLKVKKNFLDNRSFLLPTCPLKIYSTRLCVFIKYFKRSLRLAWEHEKLC